MSLCGLLFLAVALSVDAFIVSFSYGLIIKENRALNAVKLALAVGGGQFLMPLIGWYLTAPVSRYIEAFDHWLVFCVFSVLGFGVIKEAYNTEEEKMPKELTLSVLAMLGVATSIDALVVGVSLYFAKVSILSASMMIGIVTFLSSLLAFNLNCCLKKIPEKQLEITSGIILIMLGFKMLIEHIF